MNNIKEGTLRECPVCKEVTLIYDPQIEANVCHGGQCGWTDKIVPAIDVPLSFLELCLSKAQPGPKRDKLQGIMEITAKVNSQIGRI